MLSGAVRQRTARACHAYRRYMGHPSSFVCVFYFLSFFLIRFIYVYEHAVTETDESIRLYNRWL